MKKTILLLLAVSTLTAMAHEPKFSMLKKQEIKPTNEQKFLSGNTAGAWALAGGFVLFSSSMVKVFTVNQDIPKLADYNTTAEYDSGLTKYQQNLKNLDTGFYIGVGLSGFCFMVSGLELMSRPIASTEKTTLKIKSNVNGIGLCLNFK